MIRLCSIQPSPHMLAKIEAKRSVIVVNNTPDKSSRRSAQVCTNTEAGAQVCTESVAGAQVCTDRNAGAQVCTTPAVPCAVGSAIKVTAPSELRERRARRKAAFVEAVWSKASGGLNHDAAASAVALEQDWSDLTRGQKKLITPESAYRNFRLWRRKLGVRTDGGPNLDNWRELIEAYDGARDYVRPGSDSFWNKLRQLYENENRPSLSYAYKLAARMAQMDPACQIPTYGQVDHFYTHHADRRAVELARYGAEHARLNLIGFVRREAPAPHDCWFSDHHQFDAAVRIWDAETQTWKAYRPWLTAWLDWGSLFFEGYLIRAIAPNRDSVERALRIGIRNAENRPPNHVYIDNGKDYKALGFARLNDDDRTRIKSVCDLLGIESHFALPYNARAKVIERIFGIVCGQFSKLWKSYRGSTPVERPEAANAEWDNPERLPTLEQFSAAFGQWLKSFYHAEKSSGETLGGKSPLQVRAEAKALRSPLAEEDLTRAFLRQIGGIRRIMAGGQVRVMKRWLQSEALFQYMAKSRDIIVKVDPDDVSSAYAFTTDLRCLGALTDVRRIPGIAQDPIAIEGLREQLKDQRRRLREVRSIQKAGVHQIGGSLAGQVFELPAETIAVAKRIEHEESAVSQAERAELADMEAMLREQTAVNQQQIFEGSDADFSAQDAADLAAIEAENLSTEEHS